MDKQQEEFVAVINNFKEWFDEVVNTITGAADSGAKTISFTANGGDEVANIEGRDKDMFLLGMKSAVQCIGKFPFSLTDADDVSLISTNDSNRLEFLITNRLRVEKWCVGQGTEKYFVYNDEDELVAQGFTSREAIDLAIQKYEAPEET
ncbi:hypothetical protein F902_02572 [Acinetobacter higginsii]|uniref:Uncharacterized protein n=2 Tax=Moraxellaceae TaxID=468 RepID=N9T3A2_9GAMM|nr:hypothetical protein F902_02572 [Acinetobacter higginsii]